MKLKKWVLSCGCDDFDSLSVKRLEDFEVIDDIGVDHKDYHTCPVKRENIYNWCKVSDGKKTYAVAFNENPALGYSFPFKLIK